MSARLNLRRSVTAGLAALFAAFALFLVASPAASADQADTPVHSDEVDWQ